MPEDPSAIRSEIEETQARLSETVEALAYRTDIPARTKEAVSDRARAIRGSASDAAAVAASAVNALVSDARENLPSSKTTKQTANTLWLFTKTFAKENPLSVALAALAVGSLVGLARSVTKPKDE